VERKDHRVILIKVIKPNEEDAMVDESVDVLGLLRKRVADTDLDFLREAVAVLAEALMEAEVSAQIGAGYRERTPGRLTQRNGYRPRRWDTRVGTLELQIPKLRDGNYFPALLDPRRRSERALLAVVQQAYVEGVSTRRVDDLVKALGCEGISKSQVSRICQELDVVVAAFLNRPLDGGPYRYLWLDALTQRVREDGRVVQVSVVVATGVNAAGGRELLGIDVGTSEDGASWLAFLRSLLARGLSGVELVTSDAHRGLREAIAVVFAGASWQRCRTHFMANLLARVPKSAQGLVATMVRTIYQQPAADEVHAQHARVVAQLEPRFPDAAALLAEAAADILAFTSFPVAHWKQVWSNNPQERLNKEIRRRTDVVGIFPNRAAIIRLIGAVLAEQNDEWAVSRRYMTPLIVLAEQASKEELLLQVAS
jgi:putative transposase